MRNSARTRASVPRHIRASAYYPRRARAAATAAAAAAMPQPPSLRSTHAKTERKVVCTAFLVAFIRASRRLLVVLRNVSDFAKAPAFFLLLLSDEKNELELCVTLPRETARQRLSSRAARSTHSSTVWSIPPSRRKGSSLICPECAVSALAVSPPCSCGTQRRRCTPPRWSPLHHHRREPGVRVCVCARRRHSRRLPARRTRGSRVAVSSMAGLQSKTKPVGLQQGEPCLSSTHDGIAGLPAAGSRGPCTKHLRMHARVVGTSGARKLGADHARGMLQQRAV